MSIQEPLFIRALDGVLSRIDSTFKIDLTGPPAPEFEWPADDKRDYRKELLRELHADMRAQRETELKMVPLFFQVCTFVLAANYLALFNSGHLAVLIAYVLLSLASVTFISIFWVQLHIRFAHDHGTYRYLGARVHAIRRSWEVEPFFAPAPARQPLGAGPGYKMNQRLVATAAIFMILAVASGLVVRLLACLLNSAP